MMKPSHPQVSSCSLSATPSLWTKSARLSAATAFVVVWRSGRTAADSCRRHADQAEYQAGIHDLTHRAANCQSSSGVIASSFCNLQFSIFNLRPKKHACSLVLGVPVQKVEGQIGHRFDIDEVSSLRSKAMSNLPSTSGQARQGLMNTHVFRPEIEKMKLQIGKMKMQ